MIKLNRAERLKVIRDSIALMKEIEAEVLGFGGVPKETTSPIPEQPTNKVLEEYQDTAHAWDVKSHLPTLKIKLTIQVEDGESQPAPQFPLFEEFINPELTPLELLREVVKSMEHHENEGNTIIDIELGYVSRPPELNVVTKESPEGGEAKYSDQETTTPEANK